MAANASLSYILLGLNQKEIKHGLVFQHLCESAEIHSGWTSLDHMLTPEPVTVIVLVGLDLIQELCWSHVDHKLRGKAVDPREILWLSPE